MPPAYTSRRGFKVISQLSIFMQKIGTDLQHRGAFIVSVLSWYGNPNQSDEGRGNLYALAYVVAQL